MEWIIPLTLLLTALVIQEFLKKKKKWKAVAILMAIGIFLSSAIIGIDQTAQTLDYEVWSGKVVGWDHNEEWDEWHPPVTNCSTSSNGSTSCTTTPGYWEHHSAENYIETTDEGRIYVDVTPDGRQMDDGFPNTTEELKQFWKPNTPSASVHSYKNKVKASYSVFKHKEINVEDYPDLPEYPSDVRSFINIDRIIGFVPNKASALETLAYWNTELNKPVPNPEKPGKMKSWKEVNLIFVNVGASKPMEYGFALQDKWEGGNKNDFVVSFSMNEDGTVNWVYPFSWSEAEILKLEVKDYVMGLKKINDFEPVVNKVAGMVADEFVRKQFADFEYLNIDVSTTAQVILWLMCVGVVFARRLFDEKGRKTRW